MSETSNQPQPGEKTAWPLPPHPVGPFGPTLTMSWVSEYRNIQSRVMLSFSRMSCWAVRVSPVPCTCPQEEECRDSTDINWQNGTKLWIYSSATTLPPLPFYRWGK